jgi:hypothetical protein
MIIARIRIRKLRENEDVELSTNRWTSKQKRPDSRRVDGWITESEISMYMMNSINLVFKLFTMYF